MIEPYEINDLKIFHIDLYRVENNRAKRDRFRRISTRSKFHQLYRMAEKGSGFLKEPDIAISLFHEGEAARKCEVVTSLDFNL